MSVREWNDTASGSSAERRADSSTGVRRGSADRRRTLTLALGLLWLLDAVLQYQPYMFTTAFPDEVIRPTGEGNPGWVRDPVEWSASLMAHHIVALNAVFATIQLAIALGLFWRRTVKRALAASVLWSLSVWWLGEGLGGILTGAVSPLDGLPGAVLLYAVIAVLLWPWGDTPDRPSVTSVATDSPVRRGGAVAVWLLLWLGFAVEAVLPANRAPGAVHDLIAGMAEGEPSWISGIDSWGARLVAGHDLGSSVALALCCVLIGVSALGPAVVVRTGVVLAVVVSLAIWVVAQDFGELATGQATDPNTGPVLVLLAACYWPIRSRSPVAGDSPE